MRDIDPELVDSLRGAPGVEVVEAPIKVSGGYVVAPDSPVLRVGLQPGVVSLARGASENNGVPAVKTSNVFTFVDPALVDEDGSTPTAFVRMAGDALQPESVLDGVRSAAALADVPVTMTQAFERRGNTVAMVERLLTITRLMSLVALVIAAAGIADTVFLSWRERRGDRRLLNTLGLTPLGSAGVMAVELVLLAVPAGLLGWVFGAWAGEWIAGVAVG